MYCEIAAWRESVGIKCTCKYFSTSPFPFQSKKCDLSQGKFKQAPQTPGSQAQVFFLLAAAFALAAFFRLLRIMTMLRKEPTTIEPSSKMITGIRIAQTRGGNRSCSGCPGSTKGLKLSSGLFRYVEVGTVPSTMSTLYSRGKQLWL